MHSFSFADYCIGELASPFISGQFPVNFSHFAGIDPGSDSCIDFPANPDYSESHEQLLEKEKRILGSRDPDQ